MQDSVRSLDPNVRASRYLIAQTTGTCPQCLKPTRLVAVGLLPGHEVLELDDDTLDEAGAVDTWATVDHAAFLFHVAQLSTNVQLHIAQTLQTYRPTDAPAGSESGWANHCEQCGAPFDDQELHCEPGGAFLPISDTDARFIRWVTVNDMIEADAAGYAHEPQFFESMTRD